MEKVNLEAKPALFSEHWQLLIEPRDVVNTGDAGGPLTTRPERI